MKKFLIALVTLCIGSTGFADCKTDRHVFIDNLDTKVWSTTICPKQSLAFHRHDFARVAIPKQDGVLEVVYQSGKRSSIQLKKNQPYYLSKAQGSEMHRDLNLTDHSIEVIIIELKQAK